MDSLSAEIDEQFIKFGILCSELKVNINHSHATNPRKLCVIGGFDRRAHRSIVKTFAEHIKDFDIITVQYSEVIKDICNYIRAIEDILVKFSCESTLYYVIANVLNRELPDNCNIIAKSVGAAVVMHMKANKLRLIYIQEHARVPPGVIRFSGCLVYLGCRQNNKFILQKKYLEDANNIVEELLISRENLLYVISQIE